MQWPVRIFGAYRTDAFWGGRLVNILKQLALVMVTVTASTGLAQAHHAANSQFDGNQNLVFKGVLEKVTLANPHGYTYFVRTKPDGEQEHWIFQTDAILALRRAGLSVRNDLKIGDTFSLVYIPALDGSNSGDLVAIQLKDGRIIAFKTKDNVAAANDILKKLIISDPPNSQAQH